MSGEEGERTTVERPADLADRLCRFLRERRLGRERAVVGHDQDRLLVVAERRAERARVADVGEPEALEREGERARHRERRRGEHGRAPRRDEPAAERIAEIRRRDAQRDRATRRALDPYDVAGPRLVDAAPERELHGAEVGERGREIRLVVLVGRQRAETLGRDRDPGERVAQTLGCELDREPALVARAHAGRDAEPVLGGPERLEDRGKRGEDLTATLVRRRDLATDLLADERALVAERRRDRGRVRDALERAAEGAILEREAERVGRDVLEAMRLVHHEVLRLGEQRAAHARVLQQQRVVGDDDARTRGGFAGALEITATRDACAAARVAGLVVRGHTPPEIALRSEQVQLGAISRARGRAPHQRLQEEPRFVARCDEAAERLPASRAEVVRAALQHRHLDGRAERRLQRG